MWSLAWILKGLFLHVSVRSSSETTCRLCSAYFSRHLLVINFVPEPSVLLVSRKGGKALGRDWFVVSCQIKSWCKNITFVDWFAFAGQNFRVELDAPSAKATDITLRGFIDLCRLDTLIFLSVDRFPCRFSAFCEKRKKKSVYQKFEILAPSSRFEIINTKDLFRKSLAKIVCLLGVDL